MSGELRVHGDAAFAASPGVPREREIADVREGLIRDRNDDVDRAFHGRQRNGSRWRGFDGQVRPDDVERAYIVRDRVVGVLDAREAEDQAHFVRRDAGRRNDIAARLADAQTVGSLGRTARAKRDAWLGAAGQGGRERESEEEAEPRRFSEGWVITGGELHEPLHKQTNPHARSNTIRLWDVSAETGAGTRHGT